VRVCACVCACVWDSVVCVRKIVCVCQFCPKVVRSFVRD
jgi:hypothetical protein